MKRFSRRWLLIVLLLLLPFAAWSGDSGLERLRPLDGLVIQVGPTGIILDCGLQKGVRLGDLFTVIVPGAPLVHPATGRVIGTQERKISVLKVVKVEREYAVAIPLSRYRRVPVLRGQRVRRFSDQNLLFIDAAGSNLDTYSRLKNALPTLNWAAYNVGLAYRRYLPSLTGLRSLGYDLYLVADRQRLLLYNGDLELLTTWSTTAATTAAPAPALFGRESGAYNFSTKAEKQTIMSRYRKLDEIKLVVRSLDIGEMTGDRIPEVVFTDGIKLYVYSLTDRGLQYRYRYRYDKWGSVMNVQLADLDGDGRDEIIINTLNETEDGFSSFVIAYRQKFQVVVDHVHYFMGVIGGKSVRDPGAYFLGQSFASEKVFGTTVHRLRLQGKQVVSGEAFAVPLGFRLAGAYYGDINGDGRRELCFINRQSFLEIYQGSKRLWVSDQRVGGSLNYVQVEVGTTKVSFTDKIPINATPVAVDLDGDRHPELLLISNRSTASTAVGEFGFLAKGSVVMVRKTEVGYSLLPVTGQVSGPLQSLNLVGNEMLATMVKRGEDLLKTSGTSYLLGFPLPTPRR
ncbi:MAG: hypothetical protein JRJ56_03245 [Deltaproteobacteria bacterium]|nr:hypothetical protein [Deltaproteobacteria bacterium]